MRAFRTRYLLRRWTACGVAIALLTSASLVHAQDGDDDGLFLDDVEDVFGGEEEKVREYGVYYWAFEVPVDLLVLRPFATIDTATGFMLFSGIAQFQVVGALFGAVGNWVGDGEWHVDNGPVQQAWQQCVSDPFDYLVNRPLGQLIAD